jgi:DNA polymerase III subunit delta'
MAGELYRDVVGQDRAVAALEAAAARPVHAYLFVGPAGTGKAAAALSFAASLLCPSRPADGTCESCRRVLAGIHPDVISVEREGAAIGIDTAREVTRIAATSPVEGDRKVVILHDFHLVRDAGPALLKTIEEPPATTFFVILAEFVPPELVTIASRCVRIDFATLSPGLVAAVLECEGIPAEEAATLAAAAGGRLDRARLLAADTEFESRRRAWREVPGRLDGTGATAAGVADELIALLDSSVEPLKVRHAAERQALEERNARAAEVSGSGRGGRSGARASRATLNAGVRDLEERQRRAERRQRTDELRAGLATLAGAYRERMAAAVGGPSPTAASSASNLAPPAPQAGRGASTSAITAIRQIDQLGKDLQYNPNETMALQALLTRLGRISLPG